MSESATQQSILSESELAEALREIETLGPEDIPSLDDGESPAEPAPAPPPPPVETELDLEVETAPRVPLLLRLLDGTLDRVNRPFRPVPDHVRQMIGLVAVTTIAVSLLATFLAPYLQGGETATGHLRKQVEALSGEREPG